ncbi:MAG: efflux RND transporter periplasmic adaptor subunit [Chthoniobacteraceae bacterium]
MSSQTTNTPDHRERHLKPPERSIAIWGPLIAVTVVAILVVVIAWHRIQVHKEQEASSKSAEQVTVEVIQVKRDGKSHDLILPGDIQAYQVATLFARTNGYIKAWYTDIGAKVTEGQLIAEIEAPDVDAQLRQTVANLGQARANLEIARLNFEREKDLKQKKVVSDQEFDQARTTFDSQEAAVKAGEASVENLQVQQNFQKITAPFAGVITKRAVDVGDLVSLGSSTTGTVLFSIAQSDPLRVYVNVPQSDSPDIVEGMNAKVLVPEYPGREFDGAVARTAGAIDPTSRTLLTEVDIPNHDGTLYAGMYGQIKFVLKPKSPPILIPANVFMFRTAGTQVAVVKDNKIHFQTVKVGSDFGTTLVLKSGLEEGTSVVMNPTDDLVEGMQVQVKQSKTDAPAPPAGAQEKKQ